MPQTRLEFGPSVRGLFVEVLGDDIGPGLRARLRELGLDLDRPLLPAYPAEQYTDCVRLVARALAPELPAEEALHRLGGRAVDGLKLSILGRPVIRIFRMLGIQRALLSLNPAFRISNSYIRLHSKTVGPRCVEIQMNTVNEIPSFFAGTFQVGVELLGGRNVRVETLPGEGEACAFRVQWDEVASSGARGPCRRPDP